MSVCSECGFLLGFNTNCKKCHEARAAKNGYIPEADATPDEAFDLGYIKGYDEAASAAVDWIYERFGTEEADLLAEKLTGLLEKDDA
jgi:hypothetical protein